MKIHRSKITASAIDLDEYTLMTSPDNEYDIYRKIVDDKGVWVAQDREQNYPPFSITYEQALGYQPITEHESNAHKLSRELGRALFGNINIDEFYSWYNSIGHSNQMYIDSIADDMGIPDYDKASDNELDFLKKQLPSYSDDIMDSTAIQANDWLSEYDDEFFTKDEMLEWCDDILTNFNTLLTSPYVDYNGPKWELIDAYFDTPKQFYIQISNHDLDLDCSVIIDMRRIQKPTDISKYTEQVVDKLKEEFLEHYDSSLYATTTITSVNDPYQDFDEAIQIPKFTDWIEFDLDGILVIVTEDGSIQFREDGRYPDWGDEVDAESHEYPGVTIVDSMSIVDDTADLLEPLMPRDPGNYKVYGKVSLKYNITGLLEEHDIWGKGPEDYDIEYNPDRANAKLDYRDSAISGFSYAEA